MPRIDATSLSRVAWQDLLARSMQLPFVKSPVEDRPQNLLVRFSVEAAVQDPCARLSVEGVSKRDLRQRSRRGISK